MPEQDRARKRPAGGELAPVTVLGLGPMGRTLAATLLAAGHRVTVWNRTPGRDRELVAQGARAAESVAEAVAASPVTLICVLDYAAVGDILEPVAEHLTATTVVNLTADTPARARRTADWAQRHGIAYLDGAIMVPVSGIGRPEAVILYSGSATLYDRHREILATLAGAGTYVGADPGRAAAFDVALLDIFWTAMSGVVHAFALATAEQIAARELAPLAESMLAAVAVEVMREFAGQIDDGDYAGDDSALTSNVATFAHIIHAAQDRGVDASVMRAAKAVADRAIAAGHGGDSYARVVEELRRPPAAGSA